MGIFPRPALEVRFWRALEGGGHLLIPGPRRIGKTTLLKRALENPRPGFYPVYVFVESVDSADELFRKLLAALSDQQLVTRLTRLSQQFARWVKTIRIEEIGKKIRFGAAGDVDYQAEFLQFTSGLELDGPIVLLVDEFPQAVENISGSKTEEESRAAVRLLQTLRDCRHDPRLEGRIQFVFAGSIGLENVAAALGSTKHINDLESLRIPPLTAEEGRGFLAQEVERLELDAPEQVQEHLLATIGWEWLIPIFIRRLAEELPDGPLESQAVDQALSGLLAQQNLFEHWYVRLRMALEPAELHFVKAVLGRAADPRENGIHTRTITNLAVEQDVLDRQTHLLGILKHDGYLNNQQEPGRYRFNSPIIREWWWRNVAN